MTSPVIFLDIDGVILSGRAWLLPENRRLHNATRDMLRHDVSNEVGRFAVFDASAVALVNRICSATGARLVVASSWRYTVGEQQTRKRLVEQGIEEDHFHEDWSCSRIIHGSPNKSADILRWVECHPSVENWLVLDDERELVPGRTLEVDALEGLGVRDAAAAVRFLRGTDPALGVRAMPAGDIEMVNAAFGQDQVEAARWLEAAGTQVPRRARPSAMLAGPRRSRALEALGIAAAKAARTHREQEEAEPAEHRGEWRSSAGTVDRA